MQELIHGLTHETPVQASQRLDGGENRNESRCRYDYLRVDELF